MEPIYITRPYLPPLSEVFPLLEDIWKTRVLTNSGPFHELLEETLCKQLDISNISLFSNGTLALLVALKSLRLSGEVITTPYTFIATANSICWNGLTPVFADIDPVSYNLDPCKVEQRITPNTCAVLPVHCYGNPCDVDKFKSLGENYNLPIIYDASHAFGVNIGGTSLLSYGDFATLSFHATKVFNTFEGGAVVSAGLSTKKSLDRLKNFGFVDELTVASNGINAKMSEFSAAVGLCQIHHIESCLEKRRRIARIYSSQFGQLSQVRVPIYSTNVSHNIAYYPIRISSHGASSKTRDGLVEWMRENYLVYARRYFFPLIYQFPYFSSFCDDPTSLPNAISAASEVVCLPIYAEMKEDEISRVVDSVITYFK